MFFVVSMVVGCLWFATVTVATVWLTRKYSLLNNNRLLTVARLLTILNVVSIHLITVLVIAALLR